MPRYEITIQESGRYSKIIDADNLNDASIKALKELRTYGTGDWMQIYQNSFTILNIDELTIRKE